MARKRGQRAEDSESEEHKAPHLRGTWCTVRHSRLIASTLLLLPHVLVTMRTPQVLVTTRIPMARGYDSATSSAWMGTGRCMRLRGGITAGRGRKLSMKAMPRAKSMNQVSDFTLLT